MSVTDRLVKRLKERRTIGVLKYGGELTPGTNINFLQEAIDEALDLAVYLEALRQKQEEKDFGGQHDPKL